MRNMREDWPDIRPQGHGGECSCYGCRERHTDRYVDRLASQSLSTALRHAQDTWESGQEYRLEAEWPGGQIKLPGTFSGWSKPTPLRDVITATAGLFKQTKPKLLYRIADGRPKPLYIGMAFRHSIQSRVTKEIGVLLAKAGILVDKKGRTINYKQLSKIAIASMNSEIEKLRALAAQTSSPITVQYGRVEQSPGYPVDVKLLHTFELALQVLERPQSYVASARTFEAEPGA